MVAAAAAVMCQAKEGVMAVAVSWAAGGTYIARRWLDFDDLGAEVAQDGPRPRPGDELPHLHHADALERALQSGSGSGRRRHWNVSEEKSKDLARL